MLNTGGSLVTRGKYSTVLEGWAGGFHISRDEKNLIGANDVIESSQRGNDPPFHKTAV